MNEFTNKEVKVVYDAYTPALKKALLGLRKLVL